jgi:DNA-directed RNA polymerase subunit N (RpoN/RPB10)
MIAITLQADSETAVLRCGYKGKSYEAKFKRNVNDGCVDCESNIGDAPDEIQDVLDDLGMKVIDLMELEEEMED